MLVLREPYVAKLGWGPKKLVLDREETDVRVRQIVKIWR